MHEWMLLSCSMHECKLKVVGPLQARTTQSRGVGSVEDGAAMAQLLGQPTRVEQQLSLPQAPYRRVAAHKGALF